MLVCVQGVEVVVDQDVMAGQGAQLVINPLAWRCLTGSHCPRSDLTFLIDGVNASFTVSFISSVLAHGKLKHLSNQHRMFPFIAWYYQVPCGAYIERESCLAGIEQLKPCCRKFHSHILLTLADAPCSALAFLLAFNLFRDRYETSIQTETKICGKHIRASLV